MLPRQESGHIFRSNACRSSSWCSDRVSLSGPAVDDQLLFQEQVFCDHCTASTGSQQLCQGGEQVEKQVNDIFHAFRGQYLPAKAAIAEATDIIGEIKIRQAQATR